jgi:DNA-binding CsgD family transcriptional regulator
MAAGRDAEIGRLTEALEATLAGPGRAIAVTGEPGIGKSTLLTATITHARALGAGVAVAHGHLPAPVPEPGVMVLDDLHLLADDDAAALGRLLAGAGERRALCLLAYRPRQLAPALAAVLARAASTGALEVCTLGPLTQDGVHALLGGPVADEVHRRGGGNPRYLKVFAGDELTRADAATAVLGELAELDPGALRMVHAAAVLAEPVHPELLAAVADLDVDTALALLDTLTRRDLMRPAEAPPQVALRHPAVAEVVYERLEPGRRIALHRRAEAVLAEHGAPIGRRARHVARAAGLDRPDHATTLIAAARQVLYTSPAEAIGYLRAALPLVPDGASHAHEARVLLARARLLTGDAVESRRLLDVLRAAPGDMASLVASSRVERRDGRYLEAAAIARAGLVALADSDSATAAALHTELADHAYDVLDYATSRRHADTAAELARRHGDRAGEAHALAQAALAYVYTGDQATALARCAGAADLVDAAADTALLTNLDAVFQLGMTEGVLGRLTDAQRHLARGAELSLRTGQTLVRPEILTCLTNVYLRSGDLPAALATLGEARSLGRPSNPPTEAVGAMVEAHIRFWRDEPGDLLEALARAAQAAAIASGGAPMTWTVGVLVSHAELALRTGAPKRAIWLMLDAAGGPDLPRLTAWRRPRWCDTLAEAASADGDAPAAAHWATLAATAVAELPSTGRAASAHLARGWAYAATGDTAAAIDQALAAADEFAAIGERIELGRTLVAAAGWGTELGRADEVAGWLDRVAVLADACGSRRLMRAVADGRERLAEAPPTGPHTLTPREQEIARLVSGGLTSREIARTLFLSVRTVDGHLGRIYRKLDVANRAGLIRSMLRDGPVTG